MYLQYGIIELLLGFILGLITMKIKNRKLYQEKSIQKNELEKNMIQFNKYKKEINKYFDSNIKLLDKIGNDYHQLYQNMLTNSNLLTNQKTNNNLDYNPFLQHIPTKTDDIKHCLTKVPRDYPENLSHKK